jgi:S1-C subfamily serine protease
MAASRPALFRVLAAMAMLVPQGCRREPARLDEVQKMAYEVKPAVVRISAYATAELVYDPETIRAVADLIRSEARDLPQKNAGVIPTGAGGSGSGFVVHPDGYIVTSGHVVEPTMQVAALRRSLLKNGAVSALVRHFPKDALRTLQRADGLDRLVTLVAEASSLRNVNVINEVELSNGEKRPFTIVRFSPPLSEGGTDLAVLHIDRKNLPVLDLGDSDTTRVGESIWSVGYPAVASSNDDLIGVWLSRDTDLEATFNPGQITSIKRNAANAPLLQTNVAIYGGNSGGPAVDRDGRVVGISTWGHKDADQIKFLVPINVAKALIAAAGVPLGAEGEFNRSYDAALEAAYDGDWTAARRQLAVAEKLFPNSPDVIRFRRDVDRAIRELPFWRLHPALTATALTASLALALLLAVTSSRPRRPRIAMPQPNGVETTVAPGVRGNTGPAPLKGRYSLLGKFTILNGSRAGEKLGLGGSGIRIGRESTICEIVLENPKVSRLHAEVVAIDGKVMLIDRNSSNGTFVNDQKIDRRVLRDGDIIYFGGRNAVAVAFHA